MSWRRHILCGVALSSACLPVWSQRAPVSADRPWEAARPPLERELRRVPGSELKLDPAATYTLGELIDLAESHNPGTRAAWENAKARANAVGIARSEYLPTIVASVLADTNQNGVLLYNAFALQDLGLFQPMLSLSYTILDFGERRGRLQANRANLLGADFAFNNMHLGIIYAVTQAYYRLQNANGQREAAEVSLRDAQTVQAAVEDRLAHGLATVPDVLEARATAAQADYDLQAAIGAQQSAFGDLATALTASPAEAFNVQSLDDLPIPEKLDQGAQAAIERGLEQRPDLLQRVARVQAARAQVEQARSAFFPTLTFEGRDGWLRAWGQQLGDPSTYAGGRIYDGALTLKWTVFDGLRRENELARARHEQADAEAQVNELRDQIADQVWRAYTDAQTAFRQRQAAVALLAASTESYSAALEAYKYGVRNILDVLSAERALARARSVDVTARTQVLGSVAELAFRTGDLLTAHAGTVKTP
jgi:outer membrane protein